MRILNVSQTYYPYLAGGGLPAKVLAISRQLAERGHRVTVLTADLGFGESPSRESCGERTPWGWKARHDGVEAVYLSTFARYRALTFNPGVIRFCRKHLHEFDIVHIYGLYDLLGPTVAWFCRRSGLPYVVEPLGMARPIDRSFPLKRLWQALLGNSCLRKASVIITTSKLEQGELVADGFAPKKLLLRYNGIALEEFEALPPRGTFCRKWGIPLDEPVLLFLGRLIPRKGVDLLIQAFAKACPERGWLVITGPEGEDGYLRALEAKAQALGLERRVIFTGSLFGEPKKEALADCDVFVLPSRYENFGNAAAEAIACGRPVIVTDRCGISELVEQEVGLVIPYQTEALAKAISEILGNRSLYERFQSRCRGVASRIGWDTLIQQMEQCYLGLCEQRNAAS